MHQLICSENKIQQCQGLKILVTWSPVVDLANGQKAPTIQTEFILAVCRVTLNLIVCRSSGAWLSLPPYCSKNCVTDLSIPLGKVVLHLSDLIHRNTASPRTENMFMPQSFYKELTQSLA